MNHGPGANLFIRQDEAQRQQEHAGGKNDRIEAGLRHEVVRPRRLAVLYWYSSNLPVAGQSLALSFCIEKRIRQCDVANATVDL
jgi:hypothetical protein